MREQTNRMATSDWMSATQGLTIVSYVQSGVVEVANVPTPAVTEQETKTQRAIPTEVSAAS